jgi:hypothetical protein
MQQQDRSIIGPLGRQGDLDPIALLPRAAEPAGERSLERFTLIEVAANALKSATSTVRPMSR